MRYLISLACSLLAVTAFAEPGAYTIKTDESVITYRVSAAGGMDKVESLSHKAEGSAHVSPTGAVQVTLRVPVASFDSKNEKRDAKMLTVTEATKYPDVEVKATGEGVTIPTTFPHAVTKTLKTNITFHGITQPIDATVTMNFESATRVVATVFMKLSLGSFNVERPKMMMFQVADELRIEGKLILTREPAPLPLALVHRASRRVDLRLHVWTSAFAWLALVTALSQIPLPLPLPATLANVGALYVVLACAYWLSLDAVVPLAVLAFTLAWVALPRSPWGPGHGWPAVVVPLAVLALTRAIERFSHIYYHERFSFLANESPRRP